MQVRGSLGFEGRQKGLSAGRPRTWALAFSEILKRGSKALIVTMTPGLSASALLPFGARKFFVVRADLCVAGRVVASLASH